VRITGPGGGAEGTRGERHEPWGEAAFLCSSPDMADKVAGRRTRVRGDRRSHRRRR
jgi:hypothetical protein